MSEVAKLLDLPYVWVVVWGTENTSGQVEGAEIERVYANKAVAEKYLEVTNEGLNSSGDSRELRWIEEWPVQTGLWDARLGDELADED